MTKLIAKLPPVSKLQQLTAKDFRGGLNTTDSNLNISTRFVTSCRNMFPDSNGRLRLRYGTSLFSTLDASFNIIAMEYFNGRLVCVSSDGRIATVNGLGVATVVWNVPIALLLPGSPGAWSTSIASATFAQFSGQLIICNGIDKPVLMTAAFSVGYLADAGTGSNIFVPRSKLVMTHNNYLVMASESGNRSTLHISAKGTSGTFVGAPAPNDAVDFPLGTYINRGSPDITGLASFRNKLIVTFDETILALTLGGYNAATPPAHVPTVDDTIESFGAVSHNCIVPLGDDVLFLDIIGVNSIQRALITATLSPVRESVLIADDMNISLRKLSRAQLAENVFAIHDRLASQVMFFVPKSATVDATTDNDVFTYCFDKSQRFRAFTYYDQMPYRAGCRSGEGRVFLGAGNQVWFYHNIFEQRYGDKIALGNEAWDDGLFWDDGTGWGSINDGLGTPTPFNFEMPWSDFRSPALTKHSKYLQTLTEGAAAFKVEMFADRQRVTPDLSVDFLANDDPMQGGTFWLWDNDTGTWVQDEGSWYDSDEQSPTRPSNNEQLYDWNTKFKRAKFRISGAATTAFSFIAMTVSFLTGTIRR